MLFNVVVASIFTKIFSSDPVIAAVITAILVLLGMFAFGRNLLGKMDEIFEALAATGAVGRVAFENMKDRKWTAEEVDAFIEALNQAGDEWKDVFAGRVEDEG